MEAVVVDGEGVACEVMLLVESQGDPVTLPWLWREKGDDIFCTCLSHRATDVEAGSFSR